MNRDDRSCPSFHNPFEPSSERQQRSGTSNLAFREDANEFSLVDGRTGITERFQNDPQASMRGNGDDSERLHERFEDRLLGILRINDKAHGSIQAGD